ncbi:MAG: dicarboxylate/amino acid:cation symporter [Candidatus Aminicenantia bacterium]
MKAPKLTTQILIGLILGIIFGLLFPKWGAGIKPLADAFLRMIKMIIVPLIFSTLLVGIAGTGDFKRLGRIGLKAIIYFEIATTVALILGLFFVMITKPGVGVTVGDVDQAKIQSASQSEIKIGELLLHIIPTNIIEGAVRGDILQIIFFSCFFGIAVTTLGKKGEIIIQLSQAVSDAMFKVTLYVMKLAPIGVFAAISATVGKYGISMLLPLAKLILTMYIALTFFLLFVLGAISFIIRIPFFKFLKAVWEPFLIAFSTASSEAALPKAMEIIEKIGVPRHIVAFVIPTGYSFNLDGSTLYLSMATIFVTQVYGMQMGLGKIILIMLALMLTSKGVAGVPGASITVLTATLSSFGYPLEAVLLLLGIDRILDMARTSVNVVGNCIASVVVARWEGVFEDEKMKVFI